MCCCGCRDDVFCDGGKVTRLHLNYAERLIANSRVFYAIAIGGLTYSAMMFWLAVTG
jgi:hypothetical protein